MRLLVLVSLMLALWTAPAPAQETAQDDRGYVQAFLEDNLSAAGREVRIEGFEGALSSRLSIDQLSIADDSGQWIVLRDVTLDWTRSALLSGRVQVDTLRAGEIRLERLPGTSEDISVEDSAAQPFALPELPVSIEIGTLDAPRVTLGPAVLGQRADLAVAGGLSLVGGQGKARLDIKRTDRDDAFKLRAAYDNETRVLSLDADLREAEDGLIGTLLNLPDRPSLALRAAGEGPLSDFTASISLATGGQDRLAGDVTLRDTGEARDTPGTTFAAELSGDVAPLFQPEFRPFFGSRASLAIRGVRGADGSLRLSDVTLDAAALSLDGQLDLDPQGWPSRFALSGTLGGDGPVRLPMGGPETLIDSARIDARFDAARADGWTADITIARLVRDGLTVGAADLTARGRIDRAAPQGASAQLALTATGLDHHDTAIATALGPRLDARMQLDWQEGSPLWINDLRLTSGGTELHADARLQALADGLPMDGRAQLDTPDLARFAPLAGRDLAGAADMTLEGRATLLSGAFDGQVRATTTDLATGTPRLDPLLAGETRLALKAARDETGTAIERLNLDNDAVDADISGRISPRDGQLDVVAALTDIALVEPRVAGPARLDTRVTWQAGGDVTISRLAATLAGAEIEADGRLDPEDPALPVQGGVTARIPDLSAFAALAGTPLKGSLSFSVDGSGAIRAGRFDLRGDASGDSLATGIADLDKLIAGKLDMRFDAGRDNETLRLSLFEAETPMVRLSARSTAADSPVALSMRLADLGAFAPGLDGPLTAEGTLQPITPDARELDVDLAADGPGGMRIRAAGTIRDLGRQLDLSLSGALPLALVNRQLAPNSLRGTATYDLRLDGTPGLAALSGTARTEGARAALPALDTALEGIDATVTLGAQTARIELSGSPLDGGSFTLNGPVSLVPPHAADLAVALSGLTLTDRKVFTTTADGTLSVIGPLTGGARIGGRVTLGRADIRVPSGTAAEAVALPGLRHLNESRAARLTRARAGLIAEDAGNGGGAAPAFPLDVTINAPNRIFVRGRGLDAELGGGLRVTGTTDNVIPSGQVELIRGRLDILGKRLELTEGLIDLRGALDPYMRFVAETSAADTLITIIIEGLASEPGVNFRSQPDLPEEEVVSRLIFGRGLDNISAFQAAQLASAVATLSGRGGNGIVGRLRETFGLSNLDVTSGEDGATEVSAGAYISDNIYSEFTADSEGRREINLNLDITPSITAKGRADNTGDTGIGLFFEKDY